MIKKIGVTAITLAALFLARSAGPYSDHPTISDPEIIEVKNLASRDGSKGTGDLAIVRFKDGREALVIQCRLGPVH